MKINHHRGLIKWVVIIIIAILILSYYGFDLRKAVESPTTQSNLTYVQEVVSKLWHGFLKAPVMFVWNELILKAFQTAFENK